MNTPEWIRLAFEPPAQDAPPLLLVHGNCQAESLRVLLTAALSGRARTVRIPPVFEILPDQMDTFYHLLRRTEYLVSQPIVNDYRGLPLGTAQVIPLLPAGARVVRFPVLRWSALMPTHAIIRAPGVGDPPGVPYHDLRVLAAAARGARRVTLTEPAPDAVRALRDISREQLRIRQEHHGTVDALSMFEQAGADAAWTINHPTNRVLLGVAQQVLDQLGVGGSVVDPGRTLLSTTTAPVSPATLSALRLSGQSRDTWIHQDRELTQEQVAAAQLAWYAEHPQVVSAGLERYRAALQILGLSPGRGPQPAPAQ